MPAKAIIASRLPMRRGFDENEAAVYLSLSPSLFRKLVADGRMPRPRMVFKLVEGAQKSWRRLDGHNQLPKIIQGVKFIDGLEIAAKLKAPQAKFAAA